MAKKVATPNPLIGKVKLSTGTISTPYRVTKGNRMLLGGTANLETVKALLIGQNLAPVETKDGKALMTIWISDFEESDLGPHVELKIGFLVSKTALTAIKPNPFNILKLLSIEEKVAIFNYQTWNDTEPAVAYNREHLHLNAIICNGTIIRDEEKNIKKIIFTNLESGDTLFEGQISEKAKPSRQTNWKIIRLMGLKEAFKFMSKFWLKVKSVNPIGDKMVENQVSETFTSAEKSILQPYDSEKDSIKFGENFNKELNFNPQFFQHMNNIKFVYLDPKEWVAQKPKGRFSRRGFGRRPLI